MTRAELEHIIRAAGVILNDRAVIIVGSQSILGKHPDGLPPEATLSREADVLPIDDPYGKKADLIDGTIGEESPFHETYGIYGQGVGETTSKLPRGWQDRLVAVHNDNTNNITGYCLEPHDLLIAKYIAGRPKDMVFCSAVVKCRLVDEEVLMRRVQDTDCTAGQKTIVMNRIKRDFGMM